MGEKVIENRITEGKISTALLGYFFPIMIGSFFQQLYNTVDTIIVGNFVGSDALAAVGGTGTMVRLLVGFFMGISSGATVIISQHYGARNVGSLHRAVHTGIAMAIAFGLVLTGLGIATSRLAMGWLNIPEDIMGMSMLYLRIFFLGMVPSMVYNIGAGILRAIGDSKRPRNYLIFTCLANIVLDVVFVVIFHLGVAGVAVATITAQAMSAVLTLNALIKTDDIYKLSLNKISFDLPILKNILRIGLPTGGQSVLYSMSNLVMRAAVNSYGTNSIAAWTAFYKLDDIIWLVLGAFGTSIVTFVGQNYGAHRIDRVKDSVKVGLGLSAGVVITLAALLYFFCTPLLGMFTREAEVIAIGRGIIGVCAPFYVLFIFNEILSGAIKGSGQGFAPMVITIFTICRFRLFWVWGVVPHVANSSILTITTCYPITWGLSSLVFIIYYFFYSKEKFVQ